MHPMITPKHVMADWDYVMEHAGGSQRQDNDYEHRDDQFVVFFDRLSNYSHGSISNLFWILLRAFASAAISAVKLLAPDDIKTA